jgi:hypothetical protein
MRPTSIAQISKLAKYHRSRRHQKIENDARMRKNFHFRFLSGVVGCSLFPFASDYTDGGLEGSKIFPQDVQVLVWTPVGRNSRKGYIMAMLHMYLKAGPTPI